jgi:hypothetical protein
VTDTGLTVSAGGVSIDGGELGVNVDNPEYMVDVKAESTIGPAVSQLSAVMSNALVSGGVYTGYQPGHYDIRVETVAGSPTKTFRWQACLSDVYNPSAAPVCPFTPQQTWDDCNAFRCLAQSGLNITADESIAVGTDGLNVTFPSSTYSALRQDTSRWTVSVGVTNPFGVRDAGDNVTLVIGQDGSIHGRGGATISGGLTVEDTGIVVSSGGLNVSDGIQVMNGGFTVTAGGIVVESGGLNVTGNSSFQDMTVSAGLEISGGTLNVLQGGATIEGGMDIVNAGLTVGDGINVTSNGAVVSGGVNVTGGVTVQTGDVTVLSGGVGINVESPQYMLDIKPTNTTSPLGIQNASGAVVFSIDSNGAMVAEGGATIRGGVTIPDSGLQIVSGGITVQADGMEIDGGRWNHWLWWTEHYSGRSHHLRWHERD